jgi:prepilin-type N-terminal cleavage/methylation domain-containing protein
MNTPDAPHRRRARAAFTLIEMMIAISLGLVIVGTVLSGLRVASQAITVVNRLAQENQLMRLGCEVAHEHLDFWNDCDDPENPANQTLRGKDMNGGLPFTPMGDIVPYAPGANAEASTGWNPSDTWPAADPRTWWHGNLAEKCNSNVMLGRYSIFGNTAPSLDVNASFGDYGQVTVLHSWLYNQLWSLRTAVGYYGYFDYAPANTMYQCYMPWLSGQTNDDGEPLVFDTPGGGFASSEGPQFYPHGLYRLTMGTAIGLVSPTAAAATMASTHQQYYYLDYQGDLNTLHRFDADTTTALPLIAGNGPATWPSVRVSMQRFIKTNRFVAVCRVTSTSPLTGEHQQLVWDGIGSSLRGARLQRGRSGWATWDDDPATVAANTPSLDDP